MFELVTGLTQPNFKLGIILTGGWGRGRESKPHWVPVNLLKVLGEVTPDFKMYAWNVCVNSLSRASHC